MTQLTDMFGQELNEDDIVVVCLKSTLFSTVGSVQASKKFPKLFVARVKKVNTKTLRVQTITHRFYSENAVRTVYYPKEQCMKITADKEFIALSLLSDDDIRSFGDFTLQPVKN